MFLLLVIFSLLALILEPGHISFTGSDSRDKVCFFGTGFRVRVYFFGSGFTGIKCFTGSGFNLRCVSFNGFGFRVSVLRDWLIFCSGIG